MRSTASFMLIAAPSRPTGRRSIVIPFALLLAFGNSPSQGKDVGPWDLDSLRRPPKVTTVEEGKTLTSLYYESEPYRGKPTRVFAYLARPAQVDGKLPALVLVHGGGGTAFREWAELWARRGYVALAMDLGGQGS